MKKNIENSDYVFDPVTNVWKKPTYKGISYNDGDEIELRIASIIEQANDLTVLSTELRRQCTDWPSLYHLSGTRANVLRPFYGLLTGDILEIGAGCGAITRYLGECGANVLALEGSPRRAAIARSRTADLENVLVVTDKFDSFQCEHRFDVITLIGVFEYASLFTSAANPPLAMLQQVSSLLKPEGKLIIAIENQLGLKYFAGAAEDHIGQPMYGVEGRYKKNQPQTFGRKVLSGMLQQVGFVASEFFAPFPDYKMPVSILTEEGIARQDFDASALVWQSARRDPQLPTYCNFSLELAWPEIFKNELALDLANSHLVIASQKDFSVAESDRKILAYHYSTDRVPQYCKETQFRLVENNEIEVVYQRLQADHTNMHDRDNQVIDFVCPASDRYSNGKALSWEFIQIVTKDGWTIEEVGGFLKSYISVLEYLLGKEGVKVSLSSSEITLPGKFVDLIPQNIIISIDGSPVMIDTEWSLRDDVELGQLLFRGLLCMVGAVTRFGQNSMGKSFSLLEFVQSALSAIGIILTEKQLSRFIEAEAKFDEQVTGRNARDLFAWWLSQPLPQHNLAQALTEHIGQIDGLNQTMTELLSSRSWRLTSPLRSIGNKLRRARELWHLFQGAFQKSCLFKIILKVLQLVKCQGLKGVKQCFLHEQHSYSEWIRRYDTLDDMARDRICADIENFSSRPKISVVLPVYDPSPEFLDQAIWSVRNQLYSDWELCIADDASKNEAIRELLCRHTNEDSRIRVVYRNENGHISRASNSALEITTGEFVALLDHDDCLHPEALFELAKCILDDPSNDLIYTDEDKIDTVGRRVMPFLKPDWSPHLAISQAYLGHLVCIRTSLLKSLGGWRSQTDGAQDYDLWLRAAVRARKVQHISRVLYHWRMHERSTAMNTDSKPYAHEAGRKAVQTYLRELYPENIIDVRDGEHLFTYCTAFDLSPQLLVSIIIPTRDRLDLLQPCVDSILRVSSWSNFEVIILDNGTSDPETLEYLSTVPNLDPRVKVVPAAMPFNWSRLNNFGAKVAKGDVVVFLNNDTKVITPEWLQYLAGYAKLSDVGIVGALLLYEDGTIQHSGAVVGMGEWADHVFRTQPPIHSGVGPFVSPVLTRNVLAVTGACMAISREKFEQLGGFDEEFIVCGSDVELGLRAHHKGLYNVMCAEVRLTHFESKTRSPHVPEEDFTQSALKYAPYRVDLVDPFFNPNLSLNYTKPCINLDR